jgi:primosomal protein N' (replication factor Y)
MPKRVGDRAMPTVNIVCLRTDNAAEISATPIIKRDPFWLSAELHSAIKETLDRGEQVALFLNRRGIAQTVVCGDCGFVHRCPNCSITLTLHGKKNLTCHYCDYGQLLAEHCPECSAPELRPLGLGTEMIEADMQKLFPQARVARADRDEIHSREDYEDLIHNMENREIDILVGTQMIAKGLDFPGLTLVGLVLADVGFNMPDFRAAERNFQLVTQMSGRSGRHVKDGGKVFVQTYNPDFPGLNFALTGDYKNYAEQELLLRKELNYPPFGRLAGIRVLGKEAGLTESLADQIGQRGEQLKQLNSKYDEIQILGPAPAPLFKIRNKYRFHLLLKAQNASILSGFCRQLIGDGKWIPSGTKVQVDIDPINLL